jgi:hypothetical protein
MKVPVPIGVVKYFIILHLALSVFSCRGSRDIPPRKNSKTVDTSKKSNAPKPNEPPGKMAKKIARQPDLLYSKIYCGPNDQVYSQTTDGKMYRLKRFEDLEKGRFNYENTWKFIEEPNIDHVKDLYVTNQKYCYLTAEDYLYCHRDGKVIKVDDKKVIHVEYDLGYNYIYYINVDGELIFVWMSDSLEDSSSNEKYHIRKGEKFKLIGGQCAVKENNNLFCWRHFGTEKFKTFRNTNDIEKLWGGDYSVCYQTKDQKIFCMQKRGNVASGRYENQKFETTFREVKVDRKFLYYYIAYDDYQPEGFEFLIDEANSLWWRGDYENYAEKKLFFPTEKFTRFDKVKIKSLCSKYELEYPIAAITEDNKIFCVGSLCGTGIAVDKKNVCACIINPFKECGCK